MNYYIADMHFGHANIIRHCDRPYDTTEEMDRDLIRRWNGAVSAADDVYILGDMIFRAEDPGKYLKALNGHLHIVLGNHDKFLKNEGFRKYFTSIDPYKEMKDEGRRVILFHYPIAEWNGMRHGAIHLYGHVHNSRNAATDFMDSLPNCYNVGADLLDYTPRTLDWIIERSKK